MNDLSVPMNSRPLVSIFCICKNASAGIMRCVESVLSQDYDNIEFIVQDGASTDGTLEILQEYGDRVRLVSCPDSGSEEAFFAALRRCSGDIIGSCFGDEELLPHAVSWGVRNLQERPDAGAIYGDYFSCDSDGRIISANRSVGPFDIAGYICHEIVPPFCSSFFRRAALERIGLFDQNWARDCGEFEVWMYLGLNYPICRVPGYVSKFGVGGKTSKPSDYRRLESGRRRALDALFSDSSTPARLLSLRGTAYAGMYLWMAEACLGLGAAEDARLYVDESLRFAPNFGRFHRTIFDVYGRGERCKVGGARFSWALLRYLVMTRPSDGFSSELIRQYLRTGSQHERFLSVLRRCIAVPVRLRRIWRGLGSARDSGCGDGEQVRSDRQ